MSGYKYSVCKSLRDIDATTAIRLAVLVQQGLQPHGHPFHALSAVVHPAPRPRDRPALGARLARLVDRRNLELSARVQRDDDVDKVRYLNGDPKSGDGIEKRESTAGTDDQIEKV